MKNDPIIHAPISKIVDVISNEGIIEDCCNNAIGSGIAYNRITEALASLGGEEDSKNFVDNYIAYGKAIDEILESFHLRQIDLIEVKKRILNLTAIPHPSEREVLEGFKDYMNKRNNGNEFHIEICDKDIDRYLAEKGGEG